VDGVNPGRRVRGSGQRGVRRLVRLGEARDVEGGGVEMIGEDKEGGRRVERGEGRVKKRGGRGRRGAEESYHRRGAEGSGKGEGERGKNEEVRDVGRGKREEGGKENVVSGGGGGGRWSSGAPKGPIDDGYAKGGDEAGGGQK